MYMSLFTQRGVVQQDFSNQVTVVSGDLVSNLEPTIEGALGGVDSVNDHAGRDENAEHPVGFKLPSSGINQECV